jgi:hypothetical protein
MPSRRLVVLLSPLLLTGIIGCQPAPKPQPPPVPAQAAPDAVLMVQQGLQKQDPQARVGTVISTRPKDSMAAITLYPDPGTSKTDIRKYDTFVFTDSTGNLIANGIVTYFGDNGIIVLKFETVTGGREPVAGDIAQHVTLK